MRILVLLILFVNRPIYAFALMEAFVPGIEMPGVLPLNAAAMLAIALPTAADREMSSLVWVSAIVAVFSHFSQGRYHGIANHFFIIAHSQLVSLFFAGNDPKCFCKLWGIA